MEEDILNKRLELLKTKVVQDESRAELERKEAKRFEDAHTLWMAANGVSVQVKMREGKIMIKDITLALNKVISMIPIIEPGDKDAKNKWNLLKRLEMLRDQSEVLMVPEIIAAAWFDALQLIQTYCYGEDEWQKKVRKYWETGSIDEVFGNDENETKKEESDESSR